MYLTVDELKQHLNIDPDFTADDSTIALMIEAAEDAVSKHIDEDLNYIAEGEGEGLPPALAQAAKLIVATWYANRENIAFGATPTEIPFSYEYLLSLYKTYK